MRIGTVVYLEFDYGGVREPVEVIDTIDCSYSTYPHYVAVRQRGELCVIFINTDYSKEVFICTAKS